MSMPSLGRVRVSPKAGGGGVVGGGKTGEAVGGDGVLADDSPGSEIAVGAEVWMGLGVVVGMNVAVGGGEEQALRSNVKRIQILVKRIRTLTGAVCDVFISAFLPNSFWPVPASKTIRKIKSSSQVQG
jgi:hypothetical protein